MQNVQMTRKGNVLTVTIDLSAKPTPSKTGKTNIIASTQGNTDVPGTKGVKLGVNLYAYQDASLTA